MPDSTATNAASYTTRWDTIQDRLQRFEVRYQEVEESFDARLVAHVGMRKHAPRPCQRGDSLQRHAQAAGVAMVEAKVADAQASLQEADTFDAAVCRLGLMLMPEPSRCLSSLHAALKHGGGSQHWYFQGRMRTPVFES